MRKCRYSPAQALVFLFLLSGLLLAACGKSGEPRPRQTSRSFVWQEISAAPFAGCLEIRGVMSGVYANLDSVILELAGLDGLDGQGGSCASCPFTAEESVTVRDLRKVFDAARGEVHISHCPALPSSAYRLRLVGINVFDAARHAVSPEVVVHVP